MKQMNSGRRQVKGRVRPSTDVRLVHGKRGSRMRFEQTAVLGKGMTKDVQAVVSTFVETLSARLSAVTLSGPVEQLVFCPVILPANLRTGSGPDQAPTYSRKLKSLFVARNIDYDSWEAAPKVERLRMYVEAFRQGVRAAKPRHLKAPDQELLLAYIDAAAHEVDS